MILGTLTLMDLKPRHDFEPSLLDRLEHFVFTAQQGITDWYFEDKNKRRKESLAIFDAIADKTQLPSGEVSIVRTGVDR